MNHIFFILAHKNLNQVLNLAKKLSSEFDCLIHLDAKYGDIFLENYSLNEHKNIYFTADRINIDLASFSMIKVIGLMLKETKKIEYENHITYSYVGLISGQCYPIKNLRYIKEILDDSYPKLIIDSHPIEDLYWLNSVYRRHRFISIHNLINSKFTSSLINKFLKIPLYLTECLYTLMINKPFKLSKRINLDIHGGSAWWILPLNLIEEVVFFHGQKSVIKGIYSHILGPEEHFFQTIIATYYSERYNINQSYIDGPMLVCFEHPVYGRSTNGHPFILKTDDIGLLGKSNKLFARKFDLEVDKEIISKIDEMIG